MISPPCVVSIFSACWYTARRAVGLTAVFAFASSESNAGTFQCDSGYGAFFRYAIDSASPGGRADQADTSNGCFSHTLSQYSLAGPVTTLTWTPAFAASWAKSCVMLTMPGI